MKASEEKASEVLARTPDYLRDVGLTDVESVYPYLSIEEAGYCVEFFDYDVPENGTLYWLDLSAKRGASIREALQNALDMFDRVQEENM